jgi:hypothetical protein
MAGCALSLRAWLHLLHDRFRLQGKLRRGWLWMHESGTNVKITQAGAELLA